MLCSGCSQELRPVVAFDIDGTLGDHYGHMMRFTEQYLDISFGGASYDGSDEFYKWMGLSKEVYRQVKLAYRQGGMKRTMPLFEDAAGLFNMAKEEGAEIWITTTRPYLRLDNIDPDTQEWIRRHGLFYDHMLYDEEKYLQLAERVGKERVAVILEDDPEQIDMASQVYDHGIVLQAWGSHNSHPTARRNPGVATLAGARALVRDRLYEWKERYE